MKTSANRWIAATLGALGVVGCLSLAIPAGAEEKMTAQSLIDRQQILDHITRYYYNFGTSTEKKTQEETFYAEDGVLILGTGRYEGREGIKAAYNRPLPPPPAGAAPRERTAFNVTIDNALIIVHGDTATSQVIYTEYRQDNKGDPMKMTTQGKEYSTFVKVKGQWLYKTRQIASGSQPPEGWKE
ncbi:MAG: nuclear transport factor 2 family protein [Steroidobacteraceae bacterium]